MIRRLLTSVAAGLILLSAPCGADAARRRNRPVKTPAIWSVLRAPLKRHISSNIKQNEGYFFIEDADGYNAWMGRLKKIFRNQPMRVSEEEYIVRARFVEYDLDNPKKKTSLLVDFNIAITEEGRWAVIEQTLYKVNKNRLFKYKKGFRRESLGRGVITVSIVGDGGEPEEEGGSHDDNEEESSNSERDSGGQGHQSSAGESNDSDADGSYGADDGHGD